MRIILSVILFALLSSCDLFRLRETEEPIAQPIWNDFFREWDDTLENIAFSYEDSRNAVKYISLFHNDFQFSFASQDLSEYNINPSWDRVMERDMLFNLHNWADNMQVDFSSQSTEVQANEVKYFGSYTIQVNRDRTESTYSGNFEIHFRLVNGLWLIYRWFDYRSGSLPTWGKLKNDFSQ